jgi:hypothetical protein
MFRNRAFCAGVTVIPAFLLLPTDTYYDVNRVEGRANGSSYYRWAWRKTGPCATLLRFNQRNGLGFG